MKCNKHFILLTSILIILSMNTNAQSVTDEKVSLQQQNLSLPNYVLLFIYNTIKQQYPLTQPTPVPLAPDSWKFKLFTHLSTFKIYPRKARRLRQEGTVTVNFLLDHNGNVISTEIKKSSGHPLLDAEALNMIHSASPMPKPPANTLNKEGKLQISIPISYNLLKVKSEQNKCLSFLCFYRKVIL